MTRNPKHASSRPSSTRPASSGKPGSGSSGKPGSGSSGKPPTSGRRPPPRARKHPGVTIKAEAGMPLMRWVALQAGDSLSVREAKRLLELGVCRVNSRVETFGSRVLQSGDVVDLQLPDSPAPKKRAADFAFERERVVHLDDAFLAYDKPPDLAVTPADGKKGPNLLAVVKAIYPEARAVHRIDADTTGLVLFARTAEAAAALEASFKAHEVDKTYLALVRGHPRPEGVHKSFLIKVESGQGFEKWASGHGEGAKQAITAWRVVERLGAWASLVEVRPATGRHHQIRIHMSELGHPLVGDTRYGDRRDPVPVAVVSRHMLHASELVFAHPATGKKTVLRARPPMDFIAAEQALRKAK